MTFYHLLKRRNDLSVISREFSQGEALYLYISLAVLGTARGQAGRAAVACDVTCALRAEGQAAQVGVYRKLHSTFNV